MRRGLAALAALEAELANERAAISVRDGLADTMALERARGEKIEFTGGGTARNRVRVRTRDGLESLQRAGTISDGQFRAGLLYRGLYEAADPKRDLAGRTGETFWRGRARRPRGGLGGTATAVVGRNRHAGSQGAYRRPKRPCRARATGGCRPCAMPQPFRPRRGRAGQLPSGADPGVGCLRAPLRFTLSAARSPALRLHWRGRRARAGVWRG